MYSSSSSSVQLEKDIKSALSDPKSLTNRLFANHGIAKGNLQRLGAYRLHYCQTTGVPVYHPQIAWSFQTIVTPTQQYSAPRLRSKL